MGDAVTMQDFHKLVKSDEKDPLLEALRRLTKIEDVREISDTRVLALARWSW